MSAPSVGRAQLCYGIAYRILTAYVGDARPRLEHLLNGPPRIAQAFFYVMACTTRNVEPIAADTESVRVAPGRAATRRPPIPPLRIPTTAPSAPTGLWMASNSGFCTATGTPDPCIRLPEGG
jgi:hypothetical protein